MSSLLNLFWLLFLFSSVLWPMWNRRQIEQARFQRLRQMERRRGSRVITLIHRQEAVSLLGIPIARYINIDDSEHVLRAIRLTPPDMPIDLVLHTPGGLVLASEQIAGALRRHRGKVTVFVPHYAMSGGTMLVLAADEIVMDENAVLGPVDPQIGGYPAASILRTLREKPFKDLDDQTLILADVSEKAMNQVRTFVHDLLDEKLPPDQAEELARTLTEGRWTHDFPITVERLTALGLPVRTEMPREIYELMELFPQPPGRRPSVQYVPIPYDGAPVRRRGQE